MNDIRQRLRMLADNAQRSEIVEDAIRLIDRLEGRGNMDESINGKVYPLWNQFVKNKSSFIGGVLEDFGDAQDEAMGLPGGRTTIEDILLEPNGTDSAFFRVVGTDFSCGFDVQVGGVGRGEDGWVTFNGYGGHTWRIQTAKLGG